MTATLSAADIKDLSEAIAAVCARHASETRVREVAYTAGRQNAGFDTDLWRLLCAHVGVASMGIPEDLGGDQAGSRALGAVAEQLGRVVAPVPFVASAVLATGLLIDAAPPELLATWLPQLADGTKTAAAVLTPDGGLWHQDRVSVVADAGKLRGTARHVLHGAGADLLIVAALSDGAVELFAVEASASGVSRQGEATLDGTRPMGSVTFDGASATHLCSTGSAGAIISRNVDRALAVLSAEQVGATARVLEIATEYARTRQQFGRPIGSFQAIKHSCADILVGLEWSRSASQAALESVEGDTAELSWRASMAKAVCAQTLRDATHANVQIHGGIGFTWENSAHLYLKRARTDETIFGSTGQHWDRIVSHSPGSAELDAPADLTEVREQIRNFLAQAPRPSDLRNYGATPTDSDLDAGRQWHGYLADHGYTCLHWPTEHGGRDASVAFQAIFAEECAKAGVPRQLAITAPDLVGPVLIAYGSTAQQQSLLEPIRTGEHIWTQLFSEPDAGSDLAGVRTKAQKTSDGWQIDGQKVWSSGAHVAAYGLLLARTGSGVHDGLSMFVVPMDAVGITVRPLTQIDSESKFNEVFLDAVQLGDDALIGEVGQGWKIALLTLGRERLSLGAQAVGMFERHGNLVAAAADRHLLDSATSRALAKLWSRIWLLRFTWQRAIAGEDLNSAAFSVLKLMASETDRDLGDMATDVLGTDACVAPDREPLVHAMLVGRAQTILGGTSEIQRNILGERVLKLPREPR